MIQKYLLSLCFLLGTFQASAGLELSMASSKDVDSLFTTIDFDALKDALFYQSESPNLKIIFPDSLVGMDIEVDGLKSTQKVDTLLNLNNLERGDHNMTVYYRSTQGNIDALSYSFKVKSSPPLITNDAVVLGLLMLILYVVFRSSKSEKSGIKTFYKWVPALLLCYFIPAAFNSVGIISSEVSKLYTVASQYLLPASLILLCISIDIPAIKRLGSKAIIMFFAATLGIIIGGPLALWLVSLIDPSVLNDSIWRGLSTVAGSWIGGGANQTAMKEIYEAPDQLFSAMIVVDVFIANVFMSVLLFGTGMNDRLNRFFKADDSAIEALKKKMETFQASVTRVATFNDLIYMMGITFGLVGLAHFIAGYVAPWIGAGLNNMKTKFDPSLGTSFEAQKGFNDTAADLMVSFGSGFFWLVVLATIFGVVMSFTKFRNFEGVGASKFGSLFLYVLVATIGMKMDIMELIANWGVFKYLILIGLIWIIVHAIFLFIVAKLIKAPFFYVAVGSQANVGGAASAPIVASAFSPSLAPVGVLLAVLGYAVGTFGAIICTIMMQWLSQG